MSGLWRKSGEENSNDRHGFVYYENRNKVKREVIANKYCTKMINN